MELDRRFNENRNFWNGRCGKGQGKAHNTHTYEIKWSENDRMRIGMETVRQVLDGSFSGDKKTEYAREDAAQNVYMGN